MDHIISGYKKQIDSYVYLSSRACDMFSSFDAISIDEFYTYIVPQDLIEYRKTIEELLSGKVNEASVRFSSNRTGKTLYYQEDFKIDSDGVILSIINDIPPWVKKEENAVIMAHFDPVSGAYNKSKLVYDLAELIKINKF